MSTTTAPHAPGVNGYGAVAAEPSLGAHGTEVHDTGGTTFELLKRKCGGFVSPHKSGSAFGDDTTRYARGFAYDFGNGGMQIRPFGADNPHPTNSEPAVDVVLPDGRVLKPQVPDQPAGTSPAPRLPIAALPDNRPVPPSAPAVGPLTDNHKISFITDIGPFECMCVSATITDDTWITLLGNSLPRIESGKRFTMEIDGHRYRCYSPGISVDLHIGPHQVRVAHYAIEANE